MKFIRENIQKNIPKKIKFVKNNLFFFYIFKFISEIQNNNFFGKIDAKLEKTKYYQHR